MLIAGNITLCFSLPDRYEQEGFKEGYKVGKVLGIRDSFKQAAQNFNYMCFTVSLFTI